jgi:lipopolysaccharide export LptBFGC system permease protein LptF
MSGILGVSYILFIGVCASLGYGGTLSPPLAGWAPALAATLLAGVFAWQNQS